MMLAGPVYLLTNPVSVGYHQNPISVYFCYSADMRLQQCIAEVTNTPWGERVTFLFDPRGTHTPKSLHVSPMMDMKNTWCELHPRRSMPLQAAHPPPGPLRHTHANGSSRAVARRMHAAPAPQRATRRRVQVPRGI